MSGNNKPENTQPTTSANVPAEVQAELDELRAKLAEKDQEIEVKDKLLDEASSQDQVLSDLQDALADAQRQVVKNEADRQTVAASAAPISAIGVGLASERVVERVVLTHGYDYKILDPYDPRKIIGNDLAKRGNTVKVTESIARKGERDKALGTQADLNALIAIETGTPNVRILDDLDELEVIAWLNVNQTVTQLAQVEAMENYRDGGPRKGVLEVIAAIREHKDGGVPEMEDDIENLGTI